MKEFNQLNGNEAAAFYNEFGVIPTTNVNSAFSPPISMYQALLIALENEGLEQNITHRQVGECLPYEGRNSHKQYFVSST